jgi:TonB family protein
MLRIIRTNFVLSSLLILIAPALAQLSRVPNPMARPADLDNVGIAIEQIGVLPYPPMMIYNAIYSGEVRAVISVDQDGILTDCLLAAYTHREFADAALAALKRWRYQAARVNGRSVASRANVLFEFREQGVIVQSFPGAMMRHAYFSALDQRFVYQAYQLRDLDRIPVTVHVVTPVVNADSSPHRVVVEFFIDEEGNVRIPAVSRDAADDIYAAAAVAAVEKWRFEPPLRKGRPVLLETQQEFKFKPKD